MTITAADTMPTPRTDPAPAPNWTARPYADDDRADVLRWFTEPDFFYRTAQPDTRPEWEVMDLVGDDTRVLLADGHPVGLVALEGIGPVHGCHFQLHLRLRADVPDRWWSSAFEEVVRAARWRREVIRLSMLVGDFDSHGMEIAGTLDLSYEGTLPGITVHDGQRYGYAYFSHVWPPA